MTSYNKYHKRHNEKKKSIGYKKITFDLNPEANALANEIKQELNNKGIMKTNRDFYMDGLMLNRDKSLNI